MKYINTEKIEKIEKIQIKPNNFYVAIDFDKTITTLESADSWDATGNSLGEKFNQKMTELYQIYRPIEVDYKITFEEKNKAMEKWYNECMELYYEYHLTKAKLEKSIATSDIIFRKGAKEFFEKMHEKDIPVIILSAGIGNTIEQFLKENNCYFKNMLIISNFIEFDTNEKMKRFDKKIIHTLNKNMKGHLPSNLEENLKERQYRILFGDMIEDKKMIAQDEWKQTIMIGFLNEHIEENLEIYIKNFDIVLTKEDATFDEINQLLFENK